MGTVEIEQDLDWTVYPNPVSDAISLKGLENESVASIKVLNMNGAIVLDIDSPQSISVSELKAGMYFVRIVRNGKVQQQKFVVQ